MEPGGLYWNAFINRFAVTGGSSLAAGSRYLFGLREGTSRSGEVDERLKPIEWSQRFG